MTNNTSASCSLNWGSPHANFVRAPPNPYIHMDAYGNYNEYYEFHVVVCVFCVFVFRLRCVLCFAFVRAFVLCAYF